MGRLKSQFITGIVLLAPFIGTAYLIGWIVRSADNAFPLSMRPRIHDVPLPGVGLLAAVFVTWSVGVLAHNIFGKRLVTAMEWMFTHVPLFGATYGLIKQVFESVFSQGAESFKRAVLIEYPRPGVWAIAFVTSANAGEALAESIGADLISIYVPTTPNPTSGFYLLVDKKQVRELAMPVAEAFRLVITMGIAKEPELITTTAKLRRDDITRVAREAMKPSEPPKS